ncbi:MAG TPA: MFS transporter [Actinocatenispora sp.]
MGERTATPEQIRRATLAGAVGTVIEWYDYALYGAASALYVGPLFFPNSSPTAATLAAFATFAVGFFARPLGGVVISHFGDRIGRKPALVATIALMGGSTVLMGLLPTYHQVGVLAPILLVALRVLQGFGAGAELAGATTMISEYVPANRRGFFTSIPNAATAVGLSLATVAFLGVQGMSASSASAWGWRVPFLASVVIFAVAMLIRRSLAETPEFTATAGTPTNAPIVRLFRERPKQVLLAFLAVTGHNANAYVLNTFALSYLTGTLHMSDGAGLAAVLVAGVVAVASTPLFGRWADRRGSATVFAFGAAFVAVAAFPFFLLLDTRNVVVVVLTMSAGYGVGFGAMAGAQGAFLADLFDTRYRFSGIAVAREANGMLVAGPTPFIAAALVSAAGGRPWLVATFLVVCAAITLAALAAERGIRTRSARRDGTPRRD